jgi:hypothetical protein
VLSLRVTRDRPGYDHIYLIEESRRRGRSEGRLLYWSRMPGGLRVGRDPFDEDTRARLERANPGVAFDWPSLTKSLNASLAAARWAARQQQEPRPGGNRPPPPRDQRRPPQRDAQRRRWREDDEEAGEDVEAPAAETAPGLSGGAESEPDANG